MDAYVKKMNDEEIEEESLKFREKEEKEFLKFRIATILLCFLILNTSLLARVFQLQILSSQELKKLYYQQHSKALERRKLIKDLQQDINKLNTEQQKQVTDTLILGVKKVNLQKEIAELQTRQTKLLGDVQLLQKTISSLSIIQEKEMNQIVKIIEANSAKEKWPTVIMSYLTGIISSIIATAIYNYLAKRGIKSSIDQIMKLFKKGLFNVNENGH